MKQNCWEMKGCGRQPGGIKAKDLGICPAAGLTNMDSINFGKNGGRVCWAVAGTLCGGMVQGTYAEKKASCLTCEFYLTVKKEEGGSFKLMPPGQDYHRAQKVAS